MTRFLIKSIEAGCQQSACRKILRNQAGKLGRGEPLDGLLLPWLDDLLKGEDKDADQVL